MPEPMTCHVFTCVYIVTLACNVIAIMLALRTAKCSSLVSHSMEEHGPKISSCLWTHEIMRPVFNGCDTSWSAHQEFMTTLHLLCLSGHGEDLLWYDYMELN